MGKRTFPSDNGDFNVGAAVLGYLDANGKFSPISVSNPLPGGAGVIATPSANFTRPNNITAYAVNQLVANDTVAANVVAMDFAGAVRAAGGSAMIRRVRLYKSGTVVTNAAFRLAFFSTAPTPPTNGDGAAFVPKNSGTFLGSFDCTSMVAGTDGAYGVAMPSQGSEANFVLPNGTHIYALIQALAAYTPIAQEIFTAVPEIVQA